jgi:hypothetical protein
MKNEIEDLIERIRVLEIERAEVLEQLVVAILVALDKKEDKRIVTCRQEFYIDPGLS